MTLPELSFFLNTRTTQDHMGGIGSGRRGELIPQRQLPRLDVFELVDGDVFDDRVAGGELNWPEHGKTIAFDRRSDALRITAPFSQAIGVETLATPTGGGYRLLRCPRCGGRRRILYLATVLETFGCRGCLPLTYDRCNASGNPFREAAARVRSLRRGRRRPDGGQASHTERLARAEEEFSEALRRRTEQFVSMVYGDSPGLQVPFDEATPEDFRSAIGGVTSWNPGA